MNLQEIIKIVIKIIFIGMLILVSITDAKRKQIPNQYCGVVVVLAILNLLFTDSLMWKESFIGLFSISIPMILLNCYKASSFGGGDIKWMAACGLLLGWKITILSGCIAMILSSFYCIYVLFRRGGSLKSQFALGPFLCMGMCVSMLFEKPIIAWYIGG